MATVTGKTSAKIDELLDATIVSGNIDASGQLLLTTRGGAVINAGSVGKPIDSYPVGSIFMGTTVTNPSTLLGGGTWVAWGTGRVPVGVDIAQTEFDTVEEVGGAKVHTLTEAELAAHTHTIDHDHASATTSLDGFHAHTIYRKNAVGNSTGVAQGDTVDESDMTAVGNGDHTHTLNLPNFTGSSGSKGSNTPHNILQPYITCYMWKRTA